MWLWGSQRWRTLFHEDKECELFACFRLLCPHVPWGQCWVTQVEVSQLSNTSPWKLNLLQCALSKPGWRVQEGDVIFDILDSHLSFALETTLSLSPKAPHYHYLNIFEQIVQDRCRQCLPCLQKNEEMTNSQGELSLKKNALSLGVFIFVTISKVGICFCLPISLSSIFYLFKKNYFV